jgi:predicted nucleic-acid-binding Zn-ribbon protein
MSTTCLRCKTEFREYLFTRLAFLPYGYRESHVMLECPKCGHVEFLAKTSPLLTNLRPIEIYAGDGD